MARRVKAKASSASTPPHEIGADGWPVDPEDPVNKETLEQWTARTIIERHHRNWQRLRVAVNGGRLEAVVAAIRYCYQRREVPPDWLVKGVEQLSSRAMKAKPGKQGRRENVAIDYARWDLVEYLIDTHGLTIKAAFTEASLLCIGTPERGSALAFEESHIKVRKAIEAGDFGRYAPFIAPV